MPAEIGCHHRRTKNREEPAWLGSNFVHRYLRFSKQFPNAREAPTLARHLESARIIDSKAIFTRRSRNLHFALDQMHHIGRVYVDDEDSAGLLGSPDKPDQAVDMLRRERREHQRWCLREEVDN